MRFLLHGPEIRRYRFQIHGLLMNGTVQVFALVPGIEVLVASITVPSRRVGDGLAG